MEFSEIKNKEVGYTSFILSPKRWIDRTNAIGIYSKGGKNSVGTFAHPDIAFEFARLQMESLKNNKNITELELL